MIDQALLDLLVCPVGKAPLRLDGNALVCTVCGARYSFTREGYPNMLIEDAQLPPGCKSIDALACSRPKNRKAPA